MICPICDAEVYDLEAESCPECQTALASWEVCSVKFHARPLIRCCCCGECPSSGDRACRQCQAHFLKRVPAWLDTEFPGWSTSDEQTADPILSCVCCDMEVLPERAKCEICGLNFHRPTELSAVKHLEMALTHQREDALEFTEANPPQANAHAAIPDLGKASLKRVLNNKHEEVQPPPVAVPLKTVAAPVPVTAKPTVVPILASTRRVRTRGEEIAAQIAARIIPPKAKLLAERQASYKTLLASGSIRPVLSVKWLSGQSVVCARGHPSNFGLFVHRPGYGTLNSLPDFKSTHWQDRLGAAFQARGGTATDDINDRDPKLDVCWSLGCPMCGTDQYTFEAEALRDYAMCTASADYWWVFCHLYRRDAGTCGNCELRSNYWASLRLLE